MGLYDVPTLLENGTFVLAWRNEVVNHSSWFRGLTGSGASGVRCSSPGTSTVLCPFTRWEAEINSSSVMSDTWESNMSLTSFTFAAKAHKGTAS